MQLGTGVRWCFFLVWSLRRILYVFASKKKNMIDLNSLFKVQIDNNEAVAISLYWCQRCWFVTSVEIEICGACCCIRLIMGDFLKSH